MAVQQGRNYQLTRPTIAASLGSGSRQTQLWDAERGEAAKRAALQRQVFSQDVAHARQVGQQPLRPGQDPNLRQVQADRPQAPSRSPVQSPSMPAPIGAPVPQNFQVPGVDLNAQLYKPLQDLQAEALKYREDLQNNTGRIAGQVAGATGDFLSGLQNQAQLSNVQRGVADSGVGEQSFQRASDTAARAGAQQLGQVQLGQQQMLGGAIQGGLGITQAVPQLALQEKGLGLQAQALSNQAAQQQWQNQLTAQNQAFQQYQALLQQQQQTPFYSGFSY